MAGLNNAESAAALDLVATNARYTHIGWSENGTSESSNLARTATTWNAATVADPSLKGNSGTLLSAATTGACTITHWAVFSASTAGTQRADWTALPSSVTLVSGGKLTAEDSEFAITLT